MHTQPLSPRIHIFFVTVKVFLIRPTLFQVEKKRIQTKKKTRSSLFIRIFSICNSFPLKNRKIFSEFVLSKLTEIICFFRHSISQYSGAE